MDDEVEEIGTALTAVFEMFGFALMPFSELFDRVPIPTTIRLRRADLSGASSGDSLSSPADASSGTSFR